jgi:hypothetical protein
MLFRLIQSQQATSQRTFTPAHKLGPVSAHRSHVRFLFSSPAYVRPFPRIDIIFSHITFLATRTFLRTSPAAQMSVRVRPFDSLLSVQDSK